MIQENFRFEIGNLVMADLLVPDIICVEFSWTLYKGFHVRNVTHAALIRAR